MLCPPPGDLSNPGIKLMSLKSPASASGFFTTSVILDEITGGMDPIFRKELYQMLQEILMEEDTAIIMTTHIKEEIEMRMDYVGVMEEGTLVSFQEVGGEPWTE